MQPPSDFIYNEPTTPPPTTPTDAPAAYAVDMPSEAALAMAKEVIVTIQESYGLEYKGGEPISDEDWRYWASTLDRFAREAVAARDAEIVAALDEWRKPAIFGAEEARRKNRYDLKHDFDLVAQAYDKAVEIIRKM